MRALIAGKNKTVDIEHHLPLPKESKPRPFVASLNARLLLVGPSGIDPTAARNFNAQCVAC